MGLIKNIRDREYDKFIATNEGLTAVRTLSINSLIPGDFDAMAFTYSGSNLTIIKYYTGGTSGTLVATLTLTYSGSNIIKIERT